MEAAVVRPDMVTTQGLQKYEPTFISGKSEARAVKRKLATPAPVQPILPAPPSLSSFVTSFPKLAAASVPVCTIAIETISPQIVAGFELLRKDSGEFRLVYRSADSLFYDVSYYNASLRRTIALGRFKDPAVAALAHAIARDDKSRDVCRIVPYAAQEYIESLFTRIEVHSDGVIEAVGRALNDCEASLMGDDLDFEDLFRL